MYTRDERNSRCRNKRHFYLSDLYFGRAVCYNFRGPRVCGVVPRTDSQILITALANTPCIHKRGDSKRIVSSDEIN